jgi:predicted transposase/invertase (TIGR01784 family)
MTKNLSPHDRFTRSSMSHPKIAEEFFKKHLPEKIKKSLDFSSIKLEKESYIDDNLKQKIADLLYSVNFDGQPGFLYILFEHASKSDPLLPFRMLKYMIAIMDSHLKTTKTRKLPLVYPLILYTGEKPYAHSMDFFDLFPIEEKALAKETLLSPYHLVDLTQVSDEELKHYRMFGMMARALKHIHDSDIYPFFIGILEGLRELEKQGEESYIYSIITYIVGVGETPRQEDLLQAIKKLESVDEEKVMTLAEYLKPEVFRRGMKKGLEEGLEKGIEKGIEKGKKERDIEIAKAMLLKGIDLDTIAGVTGYSKEEIKKFLN